MLANISGVHISVALVRLLSHKSSDQRRSISIPRCQSHSSATLVELYKTSFFRRSRVVDFKYINKLEYISPTFQFTK